MKGKGKLRETRAMMLAMLPMIPRRVLSLEKHPVYAAYKYQTLKPLKRSYTHRVYSRIKTLLPVETRGLDVSRYVSGVMKPGYVSNFPSEGQTRG